MDTNDIADKKMSKTPRTDSVLIKLSRQSGDRSRLEALSRKSESYYNLCKELECENIQLQEEIKIKNDQIIWREAEEFGAFTRGSIEGARQYIENLEKIMGVNKNTRPDIRRFKLTNACLTQRKAAQVFMFE